MSPVPFAYAPLHSHYVRDISTTNPFNTTKTSTADADGSFSTRKLLFLIFLFFPLMWIGFCCSNCLDHKRKMRMTDDERETAKPVRSTKACARPWYRRIRTDDNARPTPGTAAIEANIQRDEPPPPYESPITSLQSATSSFGFDGRLDGSRDKRRAQTNPDSTGMTVTAPSKVLIRGWGGRRLSTRWKARRYFGKSDGKMVVT